MGTAVRAAEKVVGGGEYVKDKWQRWFTFATYLLISFPHS